MTFSTYSQSRSEDALEPLAIVGMAFEFPQNATTEESFWDILSKGRSAHTEFPPDRMNVDSFYHPDKDRPSSVGLFHHLHNCNPDTHTNFLSLDPPARWTLRFRRHRCL